MFLIKGGRVKPSFLIGAHRVSITRAIKELRQAGKIRLEGKGLVLPQELI